MNNRNKVIQKVPIYQKDENGNSVKNNIIGYKNIFHDKKFAHKKYDNYKNYWDALNMSPKPKSKRQQKLQESKSQLA